MSMHSRDTAPAHDTQGLASRAAGALAAAVVLAGAGPTAAQVTVERRPDGVAVSDGGAPVLFYRTLPGPSPAEPWRLHYIHPLHAPDGTVLTEDRPQDHLHQRGVYQAWRRILVDGRQVADSWVMNNILYQLTEVEGRRVGDGAEIRLSADWQVAGWGSLVREDGVIRVHALKDGARRITWETRLTALRPGVALAGTDDEKGYSGPSVRFVRPDVMTFTGEDGALAPAVGAVETGPSVAFAWPTSGEFPRWAVEAACEADGRPWTRWVLRRELSMQTCAFPGRTPVALREDRPLRLRTTLDIRPVS